MATKTMKYLLVTFCFLYLCLSVPAQKPVLNFEACDNWPRVGHPGISADGKFAAYLIDDLALENTTVVVKSLTHEWKREWPGVKLRDCGFTPDAKYYYFLSQNDSLCLMFLGSDSIRWISHVGSSSFLRLGGDGVMMYTQKNNHKAFVIENLYTHDRVSFDSVSSFYPDVAAKVVLLQSQGGDGDTLRATLKVASLVDHNVKEYWRGRAVFDLVVDPSGKGMSFLAEEYNRGVVKKVLRYYRLGQDESDLLIDCSLGEVSDSLSIDGLLQFNRRGDRIYVSLSPMKPHEKAEGAITVDIWGYKDAEPPSVVKRAYERSYKAVVDIGTHRLVRLELEGETVLDFDRVPGRSEDSVVAVYREIGNVDGEWYWNDQVYGVCHLVSTIDGSRRPVIARPALSGIHYYELSPLSKYVIYFDPRVKAYFSYDVASGKIKNISEGAKTDWLTWRQQDLPEKNIADGPWEVEGWTKDDKSLLINDLYDLWELDPSGIKAPRNITHGFGRSRQVELRMATRKGEYREGEQLLLAAFDRTNKNEGFFSIKLGGSQEPKQLSMLPCVFTGSDENDWVSPIFPIRAADTDVYLVRRMTETVSENYYCTGDFKTYAPVSDIHPELGYNWLTTELISWKEPNGNIGHGILYKPENFDSSKRYPLLIYYYEKLSAALHTYLLPGYCDGAINIPWFVSQGYLVFAPDINYQIGHPGNSVVNAVVSAASYLGNLRFVDSMKIGIQGHSRGGYETNFLITHSNVFAAAVSSCGMSDYISLSLRTNESGNVRTFRFESGPQRIGATLWEKPELYIENSPVFKADKVQTPVLIMANNMDADVPYSQGLEFFLALRRLGKRAWMLQYDGEGHVLHNKDAKRDFTLRLTEFFDYYLRGGKIPNWLRGGKP